MTTTRDPLTQHRTASALVAGGAVLAAALLGARNGPQQPRAALWYATLRKPSYTPPGPAIGAAWMVLYGCLAFGGYRVARAAPSPARATTLAGWGMTLAGIALYPFTFFRQRNLQTSGAVVAAMLGSSATAAVAARQVDRPASYALTPVVAWVTFAALLNEELWRRN